MACSQKRTHLLIGEALDAQQILKITVPSFFSGTSDDRPHPHATWHRHENSSNLASLRKSCVRLLSTFGTLPSFPTSLAHGEGDGLRSIETRIFQLLQVRRVDA